MCCALYGRVSNGAVSTARSLGMPTGRGARYEQRMNAAKDIQRSTADFGLQQTFKAIRNRALRHGAYNLINHFAILKE